MVSRLNLSKSFNTRLISFKKGALNRRSLLSAYGPRIIIGFSRKFIVRLSVTGL